MDLINILIDWLLKPCVIAGAFWLLATLAKRSSAASRHYLLATACVCLLLLPLLGEIIPVWGLPVMPPGWAEYLAQYRLFENGFNYIVLTYAFGLVWVVLYLSLGILSLSQVTARARHLNSNDDLQLLGELTQALAISRPVAIVVSKDISSPQVWGIWRPIVMLPESSSLWSLERKRFVLIHELAHVARWDWPLAMAVKISCALFWFFPPSWWLAKRAAQAAELACDDFVYRIRFNIDRRESTDYADNLLQLALLEKNSNMDCALQVTDGSPVYQRVKSMLDIERQRECLSSDQKGWTLLLAGILLVSLSGLHAAIQVPSNRLSGFALSILQLAEPQQKSDQNAGKLPVSLPSLARIQGQLIPRQAEPKMTEVVVFAPDRDLTTGLDSTGFTEVETAVSLLEPQVSIQGFLPQRTITPRYPRKALYHGIEGDVTVSYSISAQGRVSDIVVVDARPKGFFEREVIAALEQFRYRPQRLNGQPVAVTGVEDTFNFRLREPELKSGARPESQSLTLDHR